MKRILLITIPVLILIAVVVSRQASSREGEQSLQSHKPATRVATHPREAEEITDPTQVVVDRATVRRFSQALMAFVKMGYSPEQVLAAFKAMHEEDRDALVQTMLALEHAPEALNRELLPSLGEAFVLWPEVEGVYLAFLGYPYQNLMPTEAAEWANKFLVTNNRKDLVVAAVVGNLARTDEPRAFELAATLPEAAKVKAVGTLADSVDYSDPERMMEIAREWDPEGNSRFTERVFHRLGFERLDETAAWLADQPDANPTAAAAIAVHMVINKREKAIEWADSLANDEARAAAISATYQRWSLSDFDGATKDILTHYPEDHQLVAEVFKGTTYERAGSAPHYWEQALTLENESARTYALTGLLEPMLLSHGLEATQAHIDALPAGSLERQSAELTLAEVVKRPVIGKRLQDLARISEEASDAGARGGE